MITQQKQMKNLWSKNKMIAQQIKYRPKKLNKIPAPPQKKNNNKQTKKKQKQEALSSACGA